MTRSHLLLIGIAALGVVGALVYTYANRASEESPGMTQSSERSPSTVHAAGSGGVTASGQSDFNAPAAQASTQPMSADTVERWIADTQSTDAQARAAAIVALAQAPKAQALPALQEVLESGEPELDRQIALRSLHSIALEQGDGDGAIREVLRRAIYHGDDDGVTQSADAVLADIEAAMAEEKNEADGG